MRTKGEAILNKVNDSIIETERLISISHNEEDYSNLIKVLGGEIEKFLKSTVYQGGNNYNFFDLINNLSNLGITSNSMQYLHNFRLAYNGYKHNTTYSIDIVTARLIFINLKKALNEIVSAELGNVNQIYNDKSKHLVWFAGWDDYVGGMVECNVFIPDFSVDFPYALEHFNISFEGWKNVVDKFSTRGELQMGKEYVSERAYRMWKAESDFIEAGAFQGDLSEFVRELALYPATREQDLIPFLKRENDAYSVRAAIVFSLLDSLKEDIWINELSLKNDILVKSSYDYGININSSLLKQYINKIDFEIITNKRELLRKSDEILWVDEKNYNDDKTIILSKELNIAINSNNKIITIIK